MKQLLMTLINTPVGGAGRQEGGAGRQEGRATLVASHSSQYEKADTLDSGSVCCSCFIGPVPSWLLCFLVVVSVVVCEDRGV